MIIFGIILIGLSIFGLGVFFVRTYDEIQKEKREMKERYKTHCKPYED